MRGDCDRDKSLDPTFRLAYFDFGAAERGVCEEDTVVDPFWIILPIFLILFVGILVWSFSRAETILARWARRNGYEVLRAKFLFFGGKAFWWRRGRGHFVYYVTIRNAQGHIRRAYVRCGSWLLGLLSDHVTVEWDD